MPGLSHALVPAQESKRWLLLLPVIQKGLFLGPKKSRKIRRANTGLPSTCDLQGMPLLRFQKSYRFQVQKTNPKTTLVPSCLYHGNLSLSIRGGPHMRSLISIDFPAPEMEPESAHVVSAVSVLYFQCGDCNAAPSRQHSPIRRYSALLRYSVVCFNSISQCN